MPDHRWSQVTNVDENLCENSLILLSVVNSNLQQFFNLLLFVIVKTVGKINLENRILDLVLLHFRKAYRQVARTVSLSYLSEGKVVWYVDRDFFLYKLLDEFIVRPLLAYENRQI